MDTERKPQVLTSSPSPLNLDVRGRTRIAWLLGLALGMPATAQDRPVPSSGTLRSVEDLARELWRGGRLADAEATLLLLPQLGAPDAATQKTRERVQKEKRGSPDPKKDPALAVRARKVAGLAAQDLPRQTTEPARHALARVLLTLDGDLEAAQQALGRSRTDDGWLDAGGQLQARARADFAAALTAARALDFAVDQRSSDNPIITDQVQDHGGHASYHGYEVHTFEGPAFAATSLRLALRARALYAWLVTGSFEFDVPTEAPAVMTPWHKRFLAAVAGCKKRGTLSDDEAEKAKASTLFADKSRTRVHWLQREETVAVWVLRELTPRTRTAIEEGALNLCAQLICGCYADVVMQKRSNKQKGFLDVTSFYTGEAATEASYYAFAGREGARQFLRSLGDQGTTDLVRLLTIDRDQVAGLPHVQGTAACAWLIALGRHRDVLGSIGGRQWDRGAAGKLVQDKLGAVGSGTAFAEWIRGEPAGLAQRLAVDPAQAAVRAEVDAARKQALGNVPHKLHATAVWNLDLDRGCRELLAARTGGPRTALAAEAEAAAVFAEGEDARGAMRAMLTSVAGRAALLDVGTLEIGAAFAGGVLAVDTSSLRHAVMTDCMVVWPNNGAIDVPTRYGAGLPVPQAGLDAAALGYPLTVAIGVRESESAVQVGLRVAKAGTENWLPCHRFDPERPLPGCEHLLRVYGVIPQQPLEPKTKYMLQVQIDQRDVARAQFTTGS